MVDTIKQLLKEQIIFQNLKRGAIIERFMMQISY